MKKIFYFLFVIILITGMMQIVIPLNNIKTSAVTPPPDDNVNGTHVQYINGNWTVTGTEIYTDEIIVLSGNLTIQNGGSLTLKNVTLAMNCTYKNGTYTIEVFSGGSLNITDGDNDPATKNDRSNITDSPFDTDDLSAIDYRTSIRVYDGASISITNSQIRECGFPEKVWNNNVGIYTNTDNVNIQNCTIENNYYGLYLWRGDNHRIGFNEIRFCNYQGVLSQWSKYVKFYNNEVHHCDYGAFFGDDYSEIYNNKIHNNSNIFSSPAKPQKHGLVVWYADFTNIYNNIIKNNGGSGCSNLEIIDSHDMKIYNNVISDPKPGGTWPVNIYAVTNIDFYNNFVLNSNSYGMYFGLSGNNKKFRLFNNNISNHSNTGLYIGGWGSPVVRLEMYNNSIFDCGIGLRLHELRNYYIENNTIKNCISYGVYVNDISDGEFVNNTVNATSFDFGLRDSYDEMDTVFEVVNCTFNASKVQINDGRPKIVIMNFLHVNVYDKNSIVPGATVTIKNTTGFIEFSGQTNLKGTIRFIKVINQTIDHKGAIFYDPHNVTVSYNIFNAYVEPELVMNRSQTVNIHFNFDLPPLPARMLSAVSNGPDVDLSWKPSQSGDINHYLIYRNGTGSNWILLYNSSINPLKRLWTNWTYSMGASNHATYRYKIIAVDDLWQVSPDSNIAQCGDWVVTDTQAVNDQSIVLNGSLYIYPTGMLTLKNVDLRFNNSNLLRFGIKVLPGGKLHILDNDNDPFTTADKTTISAVTPGKNLFFDLEFAELVMKNSQLSDCGSDEQLESITWSVENAALVMTRSGTNSPMQRGLYTKGGSVTIENSEFTNNFVSILLDQTNNCTLTGNTFLSNTFGVFLNNSFNITLKNNDFESQEAFSIYVYNSRNNMIISNNLTIPLSSYGGVGIYGGNSKGNELLYNNLISGINGINIHSAGDNNNVSHNRFYSQQVGMNIYLTNWNKVLDNEFFNITSRGCSMDKASNSVLFGGRSSWSATGYYIYQSSNYIITKLLVENSTSSGVLLSNSYNIKLTDCIILSSGNGIYLTGGDSVTMSGLSIQKCTTGIYGSTTTTEIRLLESEIFNDINTAMKLSNFNDFVLNNCTLNATQYNFDLSSASVVLINISYNQAKVRLDQFSKIALYWFLDVQVIDWYGNKAPNVKLQIRKVLGTLIFSGVTDSNGFIRWLLLLERTQFSHSNERSTPYYISATSGTHIGSISLNLNQTTMEQVHLENSGPVASNVIIKPLTPKTISKLTLNYSYTDEEYDPEGSSIIKWYVNGIHTQNYDNLTTIESIHTSKDETWYCEVIPHDGAVFGTSMTSTPVTILNTEPVISNVAILEDSPRSDQDLHISYSYFDIDSDPEVGSQHKWYYLENSNWVYSNVDSDTLSSKFTKKGESWKCIVKPYDGDDFGIEVQSAPVTIGNTPPTIVSARITPIEPKGEESIQVDYQYFDLDSDIESGSAIKWFKNDIEYESLTDSQTVDHKYTKKGEKWHYTITPSDGLDFGEPFVSEAVIIGNTAPTVVNITILPENPTTADDLTISYEFVDEDGDSESFQTNFQWLRKREGDLEFTYRNLQVKTLSAIYTAKNELWICEVIPHDGYVYGEIVQAQVSVKILNSKPTVSDLFITPEKPKTNSDLIANYKFSDLDDDLESGSMISWYRDGIEVDELRDHISVPNSQTAKAQVWYFTVTPNDGQDLGITKNSSSVNIHNSPPMVKNAQILPKSPTGKDDLRVSYEYFDDDGDLESTPIIRWFEDGIPMPEFDDQLTVSSDAVDKDENWHFTIQVFDGSDYSDEVSSNHPEIGNSFAFLKSINPAVGTIRTVILNETENQFFQVNAVDLDNDLILYKWRLNGHLVSQDDSYLFISNYDGEGSAGKYNLTLEFLDFTTSTENKTIIEWEIIVLNVNRRPIIIDKEPIAVNSVIKVDKSLKFSVTSMDEDKDPLLTKWYFDNVDTGQTGSSFAYLGKQEDLGDHKIKAVVSDGFDSAEYSWNITVEEKVEEAREEILGQSLDMWGLILAVISGIAAIVMFLFGLIKMNKKKSKLKEYMDQIEEITKTDKVPRDKENELKQLKRKIRDEFSIGLIIENHYLILEREVDNAIGEIRTEIVEERVTMPKQLKEDVVGALEDGVITKDEYQTIMDRIRSSKDLNVIEKNKLTSLLTRWMSEGRREAGAEPRNRNRRSELHKKRDTKAKDDVDSLIGERSESN